MATIHVDGPFPPGRTHGSKKSTVPSITVKAPLARAHEDRDKFQSMKGQQELKERRTKEEVKHYLGMQRGAAFLIHHPTGELPPFSMARIRVTCVADMPGDYKDQLLVDVVGLAQMRVPLRVSVTGTPLKFDENTVGLSVIRDPPVLAFGEVPYDAPECMKLVHIRNTGPVAATLTWKMEQALVSQPPLVDVKWGFSADDKQPLSLGIVPHSSDSLPPPFRIEPAQADVPPHGIATFKVYGRSEALSSSEKRQLEAAGISTYPRKAHFVADARWHVEDMCKGISEVDGEEEGAPLSLEASSELAGNQASHTSLSTDASWMTLRTATQITARARLKRTAAIRGSKRILTLETQLKPIVPRLEVDKRSLPDGRAHVKFGVWVTKPRSHESYARAITLTNSMGADLTFTLAATGPYIIERCETSAPKHPLTPNE
ncbi:DLEC1, partial [Symbiodinium sp. KB8]